VHLLTALLLGAAFLLFVLAGFGVPAQRFSLVAFGLACWVLTQLIPAFN